MCGLEREKERENARARERERACEYLARHPADAACVPRTVDRLSPHLKHPPRLSPPPPKKMEFEKRPGVFHGDGLGITTVASQSISSKNNCTYLGLLGPIDWKGGGGLMSRGQMLFLLALSLSRSRFYSHYNNSSRYQTSDRPLITCRPSHA